MEIKNKFGPFITIADKSSEKDWDFNKPKMNCCARSFERQLSHTHSQILNSYSATARHFIRSTQINISIIKMNSWPTLFPVSICYEYILQRYFCNSSPSSIV